MRHRHAARRLRRRRPRCSTRSGSRRSPTAGCPDVAGRHRVPGAGARRGAAGAVAPRIPKHNSRSAPVRMSSRANPRGPAEPCPNSSGRPESRRDGQKPTWENEGRALARPVPLNCENDEFDRTVRLTLQFNRRENGAREARPEARPAEVFNTARVLTKLATYAGQNRHH